MFATIALPVRSETPTSTLKRRWRECSLNEKSRFYIEQEDLGTLKYFGVIDNSGDKSPVYIHSNGEINDETLSTVLEQALIRFEKKTDESDSNFGTFSTTPDYELRDRALGLYVSNDHLGEFWYTEYRAYYGGTSSSVDQFYLRADQENILNGTWDPSLYKFRATWNPGSSTPNMDILDPQPLTTDNKSTIGIGIPGGITWEIETGGSVDVKTDFSASKNRVTWDVVDASFLWQDFYVMEDFQFTQGVQIESPTSYDGFDMKVYYKIWHNEPYIGIDYDEYWNDNILYDESREDLDFED